MLVAKPLYNKIEILRLVGILLLVFYHVGALAEGEGLFCSVYKLFSGRGWIGTDLFLVLAGFLLGRSYLQHDKPQLFQYLKRRAGRIIPGYYLFLLFYLIVGLGFEKRAGNLFEIDYRYFIYFFTFTANIPMAYGHWSGVALEGLFGLCVLIQLTICFCIIFRIVLSDSKRIIILMIFWGSACVLRNFSIFSDEQWASYFFTFTRSDSFIAGLLLFILLKNKNTSCFFMKYKNLLLLISSILLLAVIPATQGLNVHLTSTYKLGFPVLALFFTFLLNLILQKKETTSKFNFSNYVYCIYLMKLPVIYFFYGLLGGHIDSIGKILLITLLSISLCFLVAVIVNQKVVQIYRR